MIQSLLTVNEQDIATDATGWTAGTNCTVQRSTILYREAPASLLLSPTTVGGATMTANLTRTLSPEVGKTYRVFGWARATVAQVTVGIQPLFYNSSGTEIEVGVHRQAATTVYNRWVLIVSEFTIPAGTVTAKVRLDGAAVTDGVWFDAIGFVPWGGIPSNSFMRLMERSFPEYMIEADNALDSPNHPIYRYVDLVASTADSVLTTTLAFDYVNPVDGWEGYDRCTLVQPEYYPTPYTAEASWLPWLAQLVGVRAVYSAGGGSLTPWYVLEASYPTWNAWQTIDPAVNPQFPVTSLTTDGTTATTVLGTQSAGPARVPVVGDPVEVAQTQALVLPGTSGNYVSSPDAAALDIVGDIEIVCRVGLNDWTPTAETTLVSKRGASTQISYRLYVTTAGILTLEWSTNGTTTTTQASSAPSLTDGTVYWLKVNLDVVNSTNRVINFYKAADQTTEPTSWTTVSTHTVAGTTSIYSSTSPLEIGSYSSGASTRATGRFLRAIVRNGIAGTTVFDADFTAATAGATSFTESTGKTVTVTQSASEPKARLSTVTGAYILTGVSGTGPYTVTWSTTAGNVTTFGGTVTFSDVSWSEAEGVNPTSYDAIAVLKHLTRTTATGIRSGTEAAIVNAARAVLDGKDVKGTATRSSNVVTVTTDTPHTFTVGDYVRVCESGIATLNIVGTVASVPTANRITIASTGPNTDSATVYITSKQVTVVKTSTWAWTVSTKSDQTTSSDLLQAVVTQAKPAGVVVTFGSI